MTSQIYPITGCIWQGSFASPKRVHDLRAARITHILNVGEGPGILTLADGPFLEIISCPIEDLERIPDADAIKTIDILHRMVCVPESQVYVHCVAGWNRSPTIVWLYLVACGIDAELAKKWINDKNIDAIPGHPRLIDTDLINLIKKHGEDYSPHPRPSAITFI